VVAVVALGLLHLRRFKSAHLARRSPLRWVLRELREQRPLHQAPLEETVAQVVKVRLARCFMDLLAAAVPVVKFPPIPAAVVLVVVLARVVLQLEQRKEPQAQVPGLLADRVVRAETALLLLAKVALALAAPAAQTGLLAQVEV
jgi:hypothetical protein